MIRQKIVYLLISLLLMSVAPMMAQNATAQKAQTEIAAAAALDTSAIDSTSLLLDEAAMEMDDSTAVADDGAYSQLKSKFVDGGVGFMSLVALCLIIGLAFCIERIIYLTMSEIDAKKFMVRLEEKLKTEGLEAAKELCRNTRGPIASICYQGLLRIDSSEEEIERSVSAYASVQVGNMEKGCSWITLFIAMAPSLGFLGTVIGMVMAFEQIEIVGDIGPTTVASGMKVALITTIFGIIVALILQLFYNYVLSKIDHLTAQMEESAITLMDIIKSRSGK
jgi:biopolymer transport protein ExbB